MIDSVSPAWPAACAALLLVLQAGLAFTESGTVRAKNALHGFAKVALGTVVAGLLYTLMGRGLAHGDSLGGWIGRSGFGLSGSDGGLAGLPFQALVAATALNLASGAMAERGRLVAYLGLAVLLSLVVYPAFVHWSGHPQGWLRQLGFIDGAGAASVHGVGAWCALAAVLAAGPRLGRYGPAGEVREIAGHSGPLLGGGALLVWAGWVGLNAGLSTDAQAAQVLLNTGLAGCAGGLAATLGQPRGSTPTLARRLIKGSVCGLVAGSAGAATQSAWAALVTGAVAGPLCLWAAQRLRNARIDDPVDAIAIHGVGCVWGVLAAGLFFSDDLFNPTRLTVQLLGAVACFAWTFPLAYGGFALLARMGAGVRASPTQEMRGMDYSELAVLAYAECQDSPVLLKMER
ncbi:MAG: ammonium transporter [Burkholderiales bacterium]